MPAVRDDAQHKHRQEYAKAYGRRESHAHRDRQDKIESRDVRQGAHATTIEPAVIPVERGEAQWR